MITLRASMSLLCLVWLTGCATLVAPFSEEPVDRNHGERTFGSVIEDQAIETKTRINLKRAGPPLSEQRIVVVSFNGHVLLAGQVNNDAQRNQAGEIAAAIRRVQQVHNELAVSGHNSFLARINDAWLTTKVKTRLAFAGDTRASRTKVVTENGVVYLMGLMTRKESDAAVAQVQKSYGVQKIVKIIEYID
jgi:osmotically-inducible protein OsmY